MDLAKQPAYEPRDDEDHSDLGDQQLEIEHRE
jgi:hypothetical protein